MNPIESLSVVRGAIRATAVPERSAPSRPAQRAATQVITISRQAGIEAGAVGLATAGLLGTRRVPQARNVLRPIRGTPPSWREDRESR